MLRQFGDRSEPRWVRRTMRGLLGVSGLTALIAVGMPALVGCGAVFPEVATPLKPVPASREVSPPPPEDLLFLHVTGARIPDKTRDGRSWGSGEGAAPDPFVIVFLDGKELYRTPVKSNSLNPTWDVQPSGNYRVPVGSTLQFDLMDSKAMNNETICSQKISDAQEEVAGGELELDLRCDGGARLALKIGPARPELGLGFFYEIVLGRIDVTRLHAQSPAARVGLKKGDQILQIMGKKVDQMDDGEAQSLINANAQRGVQLLVKHDNGQVVPMVIKEGAVYPLRRQFVRQQGSGE